MPSFVTIERVGFWLDDVADQEDADFAAARVRLLEGDDLQTRVTLDALLEKLTREIDGLRIAVRFFTEEREHHVLAYANGKPWLDGRREAATARGEDRARTTSPGYARFLAGSAEANAAIAEDDVLAILRLLDDPRLGPPADVRHSGFRMDRLVTTRRSLWRALLAKPRDLPFARVLRAFAEEPEEVSHIIAYKLYVQKHLAESLAAHASSNDARVDAWVVRAIAEWPDFPGRERAPAPQRKHRGLFEVVDRIVSALEAAETKDVAALRERLEARSGEASLAEARAYAGPRLVALLSPAKPDHVRVAAASLLRAMQVSASELLPMIADLPSSATVEAIRPAAAPRAKSEPIALESPAHMTIRGVVCDVSKIEDPSIAAMAIAECVALPAARRDPVEWLGDLASAFPDAIIAYVAEQNVYTAREGKVDWKGAPYASVDAIVAGDLRKERPVRELPEAYRAFVDAREALMRGIEEHDPPERSWMRVRDPALAAKTGPLRKLGQAARMQAYKELTRAPRAVPFDLALDALLREPQIGFRLSGFLRARRDLRDGFGSLLAETTSATAREKLREILGDSADDFEKRPLPAQSSEAPALSIDVAVDESLARAKVSVLGAETPKRLSPSKKAAFAEAAAVANEAEKAAELPALLAALDLEPLATDRGNTIRATLWRRILETKRPSLAFARVLRALAEDVDEVARAIGYKLYVQKHLEGALLEAATIAASRGADAERLLARLAYAAHEWPDFTIPDATPPELARRLRPR